MISESFALIIPNVTNVFTKRNPLGDIGDLGTDKRRFKKERNSMVHFTKNSKFESMDFLHFFAKRKKLVKKIIHQKKHTGHQTSKIEILY